MIRPDPLSGDLRDAGLGTLLRHLTDLLDRGSEAHYRAAGIAMRARYTPILRALGDGPLTVTELQARASVTQGAVSQTIKLMETDGLVCRQPCSDARSRSIALTRRGKDLHSRLVAQWRARFAAIEELEREVGAPLRVALARIIEALGDKGFAERIGRAERAAIRETDGRSGGTGARA